MTADTARGPRTKTITRTTKETSITVSLNLDGTGKHEIETPMPFLSHMLEQLPRHGLFDLSVHATGDIEIDGHHTTEDIGIVIGTALREALGSRAGIRRYGSATLVMDEARVSCALDLSGRSFFVWEVDLPKSRVGQFDTELAEVFFEAVARAGQINLHMVQHAGANMHHIIEISFKALARALRVATEIDPRAPQAIPSTKGVLD